MSSLDSTQTPTSVPEKPYTEWKPRKPELLVMVSLSVISLMVSLDTTVIVPALPTLADALKGTANDTFWTGTSYLLASAVFQPIIGSISDIFGRRELLLLALSLFTIGTTVCCTADGFTQLLIGRSIKGIGGGGILVMVMIIFTDIVPLRHRPKWFGFIQASWAIGTISGPAIGGLLAQHTTWRWIFYINFPFCGLGFLLVPIVVRIEIEDKLSFKENIVLVDWIGGTLFIASTTSFLIALTWGGVEFAWSSFRTLVPLFIGLAGIVGTVCWELWGANRPLLRLFLFNGPSAFGAYISAMLQGLLLFALMYYVPFWFEAIKEMSPTMSGVGIMPTTAGLLPSSVIVGIIMTRFGRFRWAIWSGWALALLATGCMILWGTHTNTTSWALMLLVLGLGHGLILSSVNLAAQAIANEEDVAFAAALYTFLRSFGMCLGVAIGGVVFQNVLTRSLRNRGLPGEIAPNATAFLATLKAMPMTDYKQHILDAYAEAFKGVFATLTGISGLGLIAGLAIGKHSMDKKLASRHSLVIKNTDVNVSESPA
ncbi:major facilitator superfamily transporter [Sphaerosporella brunnea]|uniref:Major facilitator superfamily transporter n=1 Tax=Sphaerosporella brunnea TaxID=1250544 RepID=A0A5J5EHT0_9PEZI|nr:major facilitator superfamily transporter [Sphaerosporella brunnea]